MRIPRKLIGFVGTLAVVVTLLGVAPSATSAAPAPTPAPTQTTPVTTQTASMTSPASSTEPRLRRRCRPPYCYGALAINLRTGGSAYATNYTSKRRAKRAARRFCAVDNGRGCQTVIWRRNGCAAVAWRAREGRLVEWAARHAFRKRAAKRKARRAVSGWGKERIWNWVCTSRI